MDVKLPNGQVIRNVPDGTTKAELAAKLQANGFTVPQEWLAPMGQPGNPTQAQQQPEGSPTLGVANAAMDVGGGAVSAIPSGLAGIAGAIKGALTPGENAGNTAQSWMDNTADFLNKPRFTVGDSSGLKTQAARSAVGQASSDIINAIPNGLDWLYTQKQRGMHSLLTDFPGLAAANPGALDPAQQARTEARGRLALNLAGNILPMLASAKAMQPEASTAAKAADTVQQGAGSAPEPVQQALDAGYKLPPSEAAAQGARAGGGKIIEGLTGSAKLRTDAALHAQKVTDSLAARDIGLPGDTPLTETALDKARAPYNSVYQEVSGLSDRFGRIKADNTYNATLADIAKQNESSFGGNPDISALIQKYSRPDFTSSEAVAAVKSLRKNATSNYKASNAFQVKNAYELGDLADAQKAVADALEQQIGRFAETIPGKSGLVARWQNARQQLAKINSLDSAIKEGTTNVSAPALAKAFNRGAPLSGNLKTIAEVTNNFPRIMVEPKKLGNKVPFNMWETGIGTLGGGTALFMHEPHVAAATAGAMLARPVARAGLLSDLYQGSLRGMPPVFTPALANFSQATSLPALLGMNPELQRLLAQQSAQVPAQ